MKIIIQELSGRARCAIAGKLFVYVCITSKSELATANPPQPETEGYRDGGEPNYYCANGANNKFIVPSFKEPPPRAGPHRRRITFVNGLLMMTAHHLEGRDSLFMWRKHQKAAYGTDID